MKVKREKDILTDMFSFSKLMAFAKCPRYAFYRYVARVKTPPEEYLKVGRAVHAGQEWDNRARAAGQPTSRSEVLDRAVSAYEEECGADLDHFREDHGAQLEKFWKSGERDKLCPEPGSIEAPFEIDVAVTADPQSEPMVPATIQGFVDLVSVEEQGRTVVDYKTVARPVSDKEAANSLQNQLYTEGAKADGSKNVSFVKAGRQKSGSKVTAVVRSSVELSMRLWTVVADTITSFRKNCKSGDWPKCAPQCFWCGSGSCEFYKLCYPKNSGVVGKYIQLGEIREVGTLEMPEWRKKK